MNEQYHQNNFTMNRQSLLQNFFLLHLLFSSLLITAQSRRYCGPVKSDTSFLLSMARLEQSPGYRVQTTTRMIKVFIHVLYDNNGTNAAIGTDDLEDEFADLLADYSSNNLCFFLAGIDTIHNTSLNASFNADNDDPAEFDPYQAGGCINIFYLRSIGGTNTACDPPCGYGGIALGGIPGTFCLVDDGNIGSHTISHEVGHCLGLSHTFASINGRECINGSNSLLAGDLIGDTNADPFSFDGESCYSETASGCGYNGSCEDPCGDRNYTPPFNNLMSYWGGCITQYFSAGQFIRVNATIDNNSAINACAAPSNLTQNAISRSSGYLVRAAINTLTTNGAVSVTASAISSFGGATVVLTPGFIASPSGSGETTIKVTGCN
jgi:hypothetical protein